MKYGYCITSILKVEGKSLVSVKIIRDEHFKWRNHKLNHISLQNLVEHNLRLCVIWNATKLEYCLL
jgi:hypothetical protein